MKHSKLALLGLAIATGWVSSIPVRSVQEERYTPERDEADRIARAEQKRARRAAKRKATDPSKEEE